MKAKGRPEERNTEGRVVRREGEKGQQFLQECVMGVLNPMLSSSHSPFPKRFFPTMESTSTSCFMRPNVPSRTMVSRL